MSRLLRIAVVGLAMIALTSAAAGGEEKQHTIALTRPMEVGQKLNVRGEGVQRRVITVMVGSNEQEMESSDLSITLNAEAVVLEVDKAGDPVRIGYTIRECIMTRNGETSTIAARGTRLIAQRSEGTTVFRLEDQVISTIEQDALRLVASIETGSVDDVIFGSTQPRRVGDTWSINDSEASKRLADRIGASLETGAISGSTSFTNVKEYAGLPCLVIQSDIAIGNVVPDLDEFAPGTKVKSAAINANFHGLYPEDASLPRLNHTVTMDMEAVVLAPAGEVEMEMRITGQRMIELATTPVDLPDAVVTGAEDRSE